MRVSVVTRLVVTGRWLKRADQQRGDPVATASGLLGDEPEPVHLHRRAGDRHPAELLGQQATDAVHVLLDEDQAREELVEVVDRIARGDPDGAVLEDLDGDLAVVVLVGDLPDDLLQHVLDGDDPRSEEHTSELQSLMRISYAV